MTPIRSNCAAAGARTTIRRSMPRSGTALIEALVSLVLLGTTGASLLLLLGQARETMRKVHAVELATDSASAALDRMVLFDRRALLGRVGWTLDRGQAVHIEERSRGLFDVAIAPQPGLPAILSTMLYRPDTTDAR